MFHNYFFLKRLTPALHNLLESKELLECFSQNKDELILGFANEDSASFIRANLSPQISLLQITDDFKRAKRNSVDLFQSLIGCKVTSVNVFQYERSFWIDFENGSSLIFKMHGSRSNILLAKENRILSIFRGALDADKDLVPSELYKNLDLSQNQFITLDGNVAKFLPALGKEVKQYLTSRQYPELSLEDQWNLLQETLTHLNTNPIFLYNIKDQPVLSLLSLEAPQLYQTSNPIDAINELYVLFTKNHYLTQAKNTSIKPLEDQIRRTQSYIDNTEQKLFEVLERRGYDEIANILMANLHQINKGQKKAVLQDFYANQEIEIKLNPEWTPQKNAENFYRKAKNQNLEIAKLEENIESRKKKLALLEEQLKQVQETQDFKTLRKQAPTVQSTKEESNLPYHAYNIYGYQVMVGKNARYNDVLSLKVANKNDLWLHAKDVAGSHVIIRNQAGKNTPKNVLEIAAQLAAWYSKRKTDTLCPVIYTTKKFIRKRKGDPPGAVVVEKEDVIMVEPKNYDNVITS